MRERRRRFQLEITIESADRFHFVPYSIELDFDELLGKRNSKGRFDRFSVLVKKVGTRSGELEEVESNLSDDFLIGNKGKVNWLIEDTGEREYRIYFDTDQDGPFPPPERIGLVGNGDCLRYNDGRLHPLHVGMAANPIAVDWDGDGITDLISPQVYSSTLESPWFCVRFYRNEGTNESPVFGEGIPLRAIVDGRLEFISAGYCVEIVDWNGDGLPDLVGYSYADTKELEFYLNTGEKDPMGLPLLKKAHVAAISCPGQITCIRAVDWFGDGRKSFLLGYIVSREVERGDPLWFPYDPGEGSKAQWPRWLYQSSIDLHENTAGCFGPPELKPPVTVRSVTGDPISFYATSSFEVLDLDGDGRFDLLVQDHSDLLHKGFVGIRFFKNVGNARAPVFADCGRIPDVQDRTALYFRAADTPAFRGLLIGHGSSGGKIRYYMLDMVDPNGIPRFQDKGFILQRNGYLNSYSGYAQGCLADWDGDGDWDLVTGCETGFVLRLENKGTQRKPVFTDMEFMEHDGKPLELLNGPFDDPGSFMEATLGQTAPAYVDWDGDGTLDLLVSIGRRLYFFRNEGTSGKPRFLAPVEIASEIGQKVAKHRNKPAFIDWDGDGLVDIIGHDEDEKSLLLFARYRDERTGELKLKAGKPLLYSDGAQVAPCEWHRYTKYFNAGDWKGKGVNDIYLSTCDQILYLENIRTNSSPRFRRPVRLCVDANPIRVGHHVSTPFPVDWDRKGAMDLFVSGESGLFHLFRRGFLDGLHRRVHCRMRLTDGGQAFGS